MELLTAPTLRSVHGFPGRLGGVSVAPFDSLNTSFSVGDEPRAVETNLGRLAFAAGVPPARLVTARQVHGDRVVHAPDVDDTTEADAVWSSSAAIAVGVRTADCLPVLLEDRRTGAVAAVHAGWRGVLSEIVVRTLEALEGQGSRREDLWAAIGPCIQPCCFEVDGDLPARFAAAFGDAVVVAAPGKAKVHLDLPAAVLGSLGRAGVPVDHVSRLPHCTSCEARFFSYRREHGKTGRQLSFIRAAPAL